VKNVKFSNEDLIYAFTMAADFLDMEEWPEDDGGATVAAYKEASKRIRKIVKRLTEKELKHHVKKNYKGKIPDNLDIDAMVKRILTSANTDK
jgi:hypothetical protein